MFTAINLVGSVTILLTREKERRGRAGQKGKVMEGNGQNKWCKRNEVIKWEQEKEYIFENDMRNCLIPDS